MQQCPFHAPADGLVIYATTAKANWRGNAEPLAAGQEVNEREELIYLPRTASVLAEVKLHESSLNKVRIGLPVRITVDALPDRSYSGRMIHIKSGLRSGELVSLVPPLDRGQVDRKRFPQNEARTTNQ